MSESTHIMTDLIPLSREPSRRMLRTSSGSIIAGKGGDSQKIPHSTRGLEQPLSRLRSEAESNLSYDNCTWDSWSHHPAT